jgi:hypothetical protein
MTIGSILWRQLLLVAALVCAHASASLATVPLDLQDPSPRPVLVEWENSTDPSAVGVTYAPPVGASYSASGNVGTLVIPIESHETIRTVVGGEAEPGTFSSVTIEIDLTTFEVTSQTANGTVPIAVGSTYGYSFTQNPLTSNGTAGFAYVPGPGIGLPQFCASQAEVDAQCPTNPAYCGVTCNVVAGAAYEASSGEVNMVGTDDQLHCAGACIPFLTFSLYGDLRFSEDPTRHLPSLGPIALLMLGGAIIASARGFLVNARRD